MKSPLPPPCNWVIHVATVKLCGKPSIGTIGKGKPSGYCAEHAPRAERMFGKLTPIIKTELFEEKEFRK